MNSPGSIALAFLALAAGSPAFAEVTWTATCNDGQGESGRADNCLIASTQCQGACRSHGGVAACDIKGNCLRSPPGSLPLGPVRLRDLLPICSFLDLPQDATRYPAWICPDPESPPRDPGISLFIPFPDNNLMQPAGKSFFQPGDWAVRFSLPLDDPNQQPRVFLIDKFIEELIDLDGSEVIGDTPGEGANVFFPVSDPPWSGLQVPDVEAEVINGTRDERLGTYLIGGFGRGRTFDGRIECEIAGVHLAPGDGPFEEVSLGNVRITAARTAEGQLVAMRAADCVGRGVADLAIPWSEASASPPATIWLDAVCEEGLPVEVSVAIVGDNDVLHALDGSGAVVDTAGTGGTFRRHYLTLSHPGGIQRIEIEGSQSCLRYVCWRCKSPDRGLPFRCDRDRLDFILQGEATDTEALDAARITEVEVRAGDAVFAEAEVFAGLVADLTGSDIEGGIQGWSLAGAVEGLVMVEASVRGTLAAERSAGGLRIAGFEATYIVDPAIIHPDTGLPQGQGFVSAVVLAFDLPVTLPEPGTRTVLRLRLANERPLFPGSSATGRVFWRDGMRGRGEPVDNVITMDGESFRPCSCDILDVRFMRPPGGGFPFRRGLASAGDEKFDISEPVSIFAFLFLGGQPPPCLKAADINGDGKVDISDGVRGLGHLFLGDPPPPEPFGKCGLDEQGLSKGLSCDAPVGCQGGQ